MSAWKQIALPAGIAQLHPAHLMSPRVYVNGELRAILARENCGGADTDPLRWHLSVSHARRVPTWAELRDACHDLRPGVTFSIGIPPRSMWLNEHDFCIHMWETIDPALYEEYRTNARGDEPT